MNSRRKLADARQRELAEQVGTSFWVEAPAGSGKTSLLTARYLRLLAIADPGEILALTFTNRAAGEMRARIVALLDAAARGEQGKDAREQHLLELARAALAHHAARAELLRGPDGLQVMTFHAFCHHLARSAPAEAEVPLRPRLLDDLDQELLRQEVVRRALRGILWGGAAGELRAALERRLLRLNNRFDLLEAELGELVSRRDLFADLAGALASEPGGDELAELLRTRLRALLERRLTRARQLLASGPLPEQLGALRQLQRRLVPDLEVELLAELPPASWEALPLWRALAEVVLTKGGSPRKRIPGGKYLPGLVAAVAALDGDPAALLHELRDLPDADAPLLEPVALLDLVRLGQGIIRIYEDALRRSGALDFVELERAALRVLSEDTPSDLQLYLDARIKHLLVDEFQDTSRSQWHIIRRLCAGWSGNDGRTAFLVGDPKQSIYAFRKAEVSLFLQARAGIPLPGAGHLPLEALSLSTNFRSRPALVGWCNDFFGELLSAPDPEADEVGFSPGTPPGDEPDPGSAVELALFTLPEGQRSGDEARRREAAWLAQSIAQLLASPDPPRSVAILPFTRTPMRHYLAACAARGIRLQVREGLLIRETPEGAHLLNLCRALARPHDDFAWAALLRAPWSWQPMALLARLPEAASWRERLRQGRGLAPQLDALLDVMDQASRGLGRRPLGELCREAWETLGGPAACVRLRGLQAVENVRRMLAALDEAEQGSPLGTLLRLETRLQTLHEPPDPAAADSPVWMMTVHGAKGLEFDAVFVPQLDRDPTTRPPEAKPPYLLEQAGAEGPLMAVQSDRRLGEGEELYAVLEDLARRRIVGEAKRLLYVATTRARRRLLLSGIVRAKKDGEELAAARKHSFLAWLLGFERIESRGDLSAGLTPRSRLPVQLDPAPEPATEAVAAAPPGELPSAPELRADRAPYRLRLPSAAPSDQPETPVAAAAAADEDPRPRGVVIHALLEHAAAGEPLPGASSVRAALVEQGLAPGEAETQAASLLDEVRSCLAEPFLARLLALPPTSRHSEWRIEARDGEIIWTGSMDLVANHEGRWFLVDYKTTRRADEETVTAYEERLRREYKPQLSAYKEMLVRLKGIDRGSVRTGLYLTSEARWIDV
jgi:ATP-dependent helicase/nuclease subunit A